MRIASLQPEQQSFTPDAPKAFHIRIVISDSREAPFYLALNVKNQLDQVVICIDSHHCDEVLSGSDPIGLSLIIRNPWLCPGEYTVDAFLYNMDIIDKWEDACRFTVSSQMPYSGLVYEPAIKIGVVLADFSLFKRTSF